MNLIARTPYTASRDLWIETFLDSEKIMDIWNNSTLTAEVQQWKGEPLKQWFKDLDQRQGIYLATAYLGEECLSFNNGRHRTRWMLQQGVKAVPICLQANSYRYAYENGFLIRKAFDGDNIL
jgi:hypothetical protein